VVVPLWKDSISGAASSSVIGEKATIRQLGESVPAPLIKHFPDFDVTFLFNIIHSHNNIIACIFLIIYYYLILYIYEYLGCSVRTMQLIRLPKETQRTSNVLLRLILDNLCLCWTNDS